MKIIFASNPFSVHFKHLPGVSAIFLWALLCACLAGTVVSQKPATKAPLPREIASVLDAPSTPDVQLSPTNSYLLIAAKPRYYSLVELARPKRGLAGIRIDLQNNGRHAAPYWTSLEFRYFDAHTRRVGETKSVALPPDAKISRPVISADGQRFAFTLRKGNTIELWAGIAETAQAHPVPGIKVNEVFEGAVQWMPDQKTLLVQSVPAQRAPAPSAHVLRQAQVQEAINPEERAQSTDLLHDEEDVAAFDYYATSQLALVDTDTHRVSLLAEPSVWVDINPSPDGKYFWARRLQQPYSYLKPYQDFPAQVALWDTGGRFIKTLMQRSPDDKVPADGVRTGPRAFSWRDTAPATLVWAEALDGGDPHHAAFWRDRLLLQEAPFNGPVTELARLKHRFDNIYWGEKDNLFFVNELLLTTGTEQMSLFRLGDKSAPTFLLETYTAKYSAAPVLRQLPNGAFVVAQDGTAIYFSGVETKSGRVPYLNRLDLSTRLSQRLFSSESSNYEEFAALLTKDGKSIITRRESPQEPLNYYLRTLGEPAPDSGPAIQALTDFVVPAPEMLRVHRELITYQRDDGVELSAVLYLPPGYQRGQRLPTVLSVYPEEYEDGASPEANTTPVRQFVDLRGMSPIFFALHGYAVLEEVAMPILGRKGHANDSFVRQAIKDAQAAINKVVALGIADPERIGVWGHSYGAFTVGNLLAHSDLFRAGIASSGAYNRTLTPFGFQNETRRLWENQEFYTKISPYFFVTGIKEPLLLLHGRDDEHGNTPPLQSRLMADAIWGTNGTARLVILPYEGHQYLARESVETGLAEMFQWFDAHVKNAAPRRSPGPFKNEREKRNERRKTN